MSASLGMTTHLRAELMNCPVDYDDAVGVALAHPKLLHHEDEGATTSALDNAVLKKAVFDSYISMFKQNSPVKHRMSVLGYLHNKGILGAKKGASASSMAHLKHASVGARYPAHVAHARYQSNLTGWIPPEYRVPTQ